MPHGGHRLLYRRGHGTAASAPSARQPWLHCVLACTCLHVDVAHHVERGVGGEVVARPEAHDLVALPLLHLRGCVGAGAAAGRVTSVPAAGTAQLQTPARSSGAGTLHGCSRHSQAAQPQYALRRHSPAQRSTPGRSCRWGSGSPGHSPSAGTAAAGSPRGTQSCSSSAVQPGG